MGAALDPYELHSERSTLDFVEGLADHLLDLFPFLSDVKVNRQWAGMSDMTPDFSPIMGTTPIKGFSIAVQNIAKGSRSRMRVNSRMRVAMLTTPPMKAAVTITNRALPSMKRTFASGAEAAKSRYVNPNKLNCNLSKPCPIKRNNPIHVIHITADTIKAVRTRAEGDPILIEASKPVRPPAF